MPDIISGYHNTPQILNPGTPSVTITGTIKANGSVTSSNPNYTPLYAAIYAPSTGNFTIINLGTVDETSTSQHGATDGIFLGAPGTLNNQGSIYGYADGVLALGGTVYNKGHITGSYEGVRLAAAGLVNNTGTIAATTTHTSFGAWHGGVRISYGGSVDNSGLITSNQFGIVGVYDPASITNGGTIKGTGGTFDFRGTSQVSSGIVLLEGGLVSNTSAGLISGQDGIVIEGSAGNISNVGSAIGTLIGVAATAFTSIDNSGLIEGTSTTLVTFGSEIFAGIGIDLAAGGNVTNQSSGTISGVQDGLVFATYAPLPTNVNNSGLIEGTGSTFVTPSYTFGAGGVFLVDGGTVTNQSTGTIIGYSAGIESFTHLSIAGENARNAQVATTIINAGLIEGGDSDTVYLGGGATGSSGGVVLDGGGALTNEATGRISANFGVYLNGGSSLISNYVDNLGSIDGVVTEGVILGQHASLANSGHITGAGTGVVGFAGNNITNQSGGTITGGFLGAYVSANGTIINAGVITGGTVGASATNGTIINAGTITGLDGPAVYFGTSTSGEVIIDTGAVFNGQVIDGAGNGILDLASGASAGTLSGLGSEYIGFSQIIIDSGANWTLAGANAINAVQTLTDHGTFSTTDAYDYYGNNTGILITVDGPGALWDSATQIGIGSDGAGTLVISNGGSVYAAQGINVANNAGSTGELIIESGGTLENGGGYDNVGGYITSGVAPSGTVTVTGTGSAWIMTSGLIVGNSGTSTVNISNHGSVSTAVAMTVGQSEGSSGNVSVTSGGRLSTPGGPIALSIGSTGTVTVDGAGSEWVSSGQIAVGQGGAGTLIVSNHGLVDATADVDVAQNAGSTGELIIESGGAVESGGPYNEIGNGTSASGTVLITGAGSSWSMTSQLAIGYGGAASVTVAAGGHLSTGGPFDAIGGLAGDSGTVTVDGAGSRWDSTGQVDVGETGSGALIVSDGGFASAADGFNIAAFTGSTGSVTIESGGTVESTGSYNNVGGFQTGASGTLTVEGTGSHWDSTNPLSVGYTGDGTLIIGSGGVVSAEQVILGTGGTIVNQAGGSIITTNYGIQAIGPAIITNSGLIRSIGTQSPLYKNTGIELLESGIVTNQLGGTIIGYTGVEAVGTASATIINHGYIGGSGVYAAIYLKAGGEVVNSGIIHSQARGSAIGLQAGGLVINTGTINGAYGIDSTPTNPVTIINDGVIETTSTNAAAIYLTGGGTVTNNASGFINSYYGLYIGGTAGAFVTNSGSLNGYGEKFIPGSLAGVGVDLYSSVENVLTNTSTGRITGLHDGVVIYHASGTISNAGSIIGADAGIAATAFTSITNSGLIDGTSTTLVTFAGEIFAGIGVDLAAGGAIINQTGGAISGVEFGALIETGTVSNSGLIEGTGTTFAFNGSTYGSNGVFFSAGGMLTNQLSGTIIGYATGVQNALTGGGPVTIDNRGLIEATGSTFSFHGVQNTGAGVALPGGGRVTNEATGRISGYTGAIIGGAASVANYIDNAGSINGFGAGGVVLLQSASMVNTGQITGHNVGVAVLGNTEATNQAGGLISGGIVGAYISADGTLTNAGTITGLSGPAVFFATTSTGEAIIDPGAVFNGTVDDAAGNGVLNLASAAAHGTLSGIGSEFIGFSQITIDAGADWTLAGTNSLSAGQTLSDYGTLIVDGAFTNDGVVETDPSTITFTGDITGTGEIIVGTDSVIVFDGSVSSGETIVFVDTTGTVFINDPLGFHGAITGANGTVITACFAAGTHILTPQGDVAVENLAVGNLVITHDGDDAPIKWIGRRTLDLTRHPQPEKAQPIRIAAGALGENTPSRDLLLSPDHALYLSGHLVPVKALRNFSNITQLNRRSVTYYHIELENHSVIFAEAAPVETYLETGNRHAFENGGAAMMLHPDFAQTDYQAMREAEGCAPFAEHGPVVDSIRRSILQRVYARRAG